MTNADQPSPSTPESGPAQPSAGGYEAPPIEQSTPPAYLPPPAYDYPPPPANYPPPPAAYPPPPQYASFGGYPPPAQPGYPGYAGGYPGYPGGYGPPQTNTLAIWSLVASAVGFICCISSAVGVVLGIVALNQIQQRQEGGRGLAIAGIVVGGVSLLIGFVVVGVMSSA